MNWPDEKLKAEMMKDINDSETLCGRDGELVCLHLIKALAELRKTQAELKEARLCIAYLSFIVNSPSGTMDEARKRLGAITRK